MRKIQANIIIVDDDKDVLFSLKVLIRKHFEEVVSLSHPKEIWSHLPAPVVLLDMNYRKGYEDGKEGIYWLQEIKKKFPETQVILLTAYGEVDIAVESIKKGAYDFFLKPWQSDELIHRLKEAVIKSKTNKPELQPVEIKPSNSFFWGESPMMKKLEHWVNKVATTEANILLLGENGTGKTFLAKEIHQLSSRKDEPFVVVDLGALNENLIESELFGHAKGAFTDAKEHKEGYLEKAKGGTLLLDEIGNLSLSTQMKLLNVIQNRTFSRVGETKERIFDARLISATNAPLFQWVDEGKFRQDLLFRINTLETEVPPLRFRPEDIEPMALHFMESLKNRYHKPDLELSKEAIDKLSNHRWSGNIRELQHVLERAVVLSEKIISANDIELRNQSKQELPKSLNMEEMEVNLIQEALRLTEHNISLAAKKLGISRNALYRRMEKYNL